MKRIKILVSIIVWSATCSVAQQKIKWEDAVNILKQKNISIKQSELRRQIGKNNVDIARASLYPSLSFSANNQHTMGMTFDQISGKLITGDQLSSYANGTISGNLVVYQGGQQQYTLLLQKTNLVLSDLDSKRLKRELELQLLSLFTQVLINHDLNKAAESQLLLSEKLFAGEKVRVEIGNSTLIDLSQAKAKYANDKFNVVSSNNAYELSLMKLKLLLEMEESDNLEIVPPTIDNGKEKTVDNYHLSNDLYMRAMEKQLEQGEIKVKLSKSSFFPTVSLNAAYGTNYSSQRQNIFTGETINFWRQFNQNRALYGNILISMPIFDGFRTRLNTRVAKQELHILQYEKEKLGRERKQVVLEGILEVKGAQEELLAIQTAYEANKINYEALAERYRLGKSSSVDLYKALTDLNISEFNLISKRYGVFYRQEVLKRLIE